MGDESVMKNFTVVQEHFRKLRCAHCQHAFTPEGVKLLREEKDYWVVRVHCTACQQPAGVAIVGVEYESGDAPAPERHEREPVGAGAGAPALGPSRPRGIFSSRREEEKFSKLTPISSDDVINAHDFFSKLGSDWMRHLPHGRRD
jgi:RNase P subunit RPR2